MNILQILPELNSGGVETGTLDLSKELIRHGHGSVVISNGGRLTEALTASGGIHYSLPVHEKSPLTAMNMIGKIREIIEKEDINLVHARSRVPAFSAFFAARQAGVPFVTTCHGYYSTHILSRVMGWGRLVIVSSNAIARHMIKDFGVPRDRIRLIPRGVDIGKFFYRPPDTDSGKKEFHIGVIGRITPIKGHVYLIRAVSKIARLKPHIKVSIIGDSPESKPKYRQELELLVRRLSLSKYVRFLGQRHDIPEQLAKMDLVVVPSVGEEAFGRSIIEAQASGVPVVATSVGGIVDIIKNGENGLLVPPGDWQELSEAIMKMIREGALREKFSRAGRLTVERRFSLENMYRKTIKAYNEARGLSKILVIKWSALGDIILSLPALKAIKGRFPKADITLLTSNLGRELLIRYPYIKEFMIFQHKPGLDGAREALDISSELRRSCIDMVVDLQNNRRSHLISYLSLARRRIGYKTKKFDLCMNEGMDGARLNISPVKHQFRLLKPLGIGSIPSVPQLMVSEEENRGVDDMLASEWVSNAQVLVGLSLGASYRWRTKRWPVERFAKLCSLLAQRQIRVVITGTKDDMPEAKNLTSLTRSKPIDITGKTTIMQLAAVIQRCRVFITCDSAPMHIAAFLGIPFVGLFGPTDPKRHLEAYGEFSIIRKRLKCSPCYKPKCSNIRCMERITPEEVASAVFGLLKK